MPVIGITNAGILSLTQVHSLEGLELSAPRNTTMFTSHALKYLSGLPLLCRISIVCSLELICDETFDHLNSLKSLRHLELGEHIAPHNERDQPDALLGRMQQLPLLASSLETLHLWLSTVTLEDLRHISRLTNLRGLKIAAYQMEAPPQDESSDGDGYTNLLAPLVGLQCLEISECFKDSSSAEVLHPPRHEAGSMLTSLSYTNIIGD